MNLKIQHRSAVKSEFGRLSGREAIADRAMRIDLGLALLSILAKPCVPLDQADIAAWCGCSRSMIFQIEHRALRKLRNRLRFIKDPRLIEAIDGLFDARTTAVRKEAR